MYTSELEVAAIRRFLYTLSREPESQLQLKLAVLSPYRAQVRELTKHLKELRRNL